MSFGPSASKSASTGVARFGSTFVVGLVIVAVGVLFLLDNLNLYETEDLWHWWPLALVLLGLARTFTTGAGRIGGLVIAGVGAVLLLDSLDVIRFDIWDLWPLLLIGAGIAMIAGAVGRTRRTAPSGMTKNAVVNATAFLGGTVQGTGAQEFRGGDATAVLGGCEIDLRQASIGTGEAVLQVFALWGAIEICVPEDWTVVVQVTPLLGGVEDKTRRPATATKQLVIKGLVLMGGLEIGN